MMIRDHPEIIIVKFISTVANKKTHLVLFALVAVIAFGNGPIENLASHRIWHRGPWAQFRFFLVVFDRFARIIFKGRIEACRGWNQSLSKLGVAELFVLFLSSPPFGSIGRKPSCACCCSSCPSRRRPRSL